MLENEVTNNNNGPENFNGAKVPHSAYEIRRNIVLVENALIEMRRYAEGHEAAADIRLSTQDVVNGLLFGEEAVFDAFKRLFLKAINTSPKSWDGVAWFGGLPLTEAQRQGVESIPPKLIEALDKEDANWRTKIPEVAELLYQHLWENINNKNQE